MAERAARGGGWQSTSGPAPMMPNGPGCLPRLPRPTVNLEVAQDLMRGILGQALGVPPDAIDLTYPSTSEQER